MPQWLETEWFEKWRCALHQAEDNSQATMREW